MEEIFFLGLMHTEKSLEDAYKFSKAGIQVAPHVFQTNLLSGFSMSSKVDTFVYNIAPVGSFPMNYKKLFISKEKWGKGNVKIGYVNLPKIKNFLQERKIYGLLKKQIRKGDKITIIVYSLFEPYVKAIHRLKRKYNNLSAILLQTDAVCGRDDMPQYMTAERIRKGDYLVKLSKVFNGFILLSEQLRKPLEIGNRPYIVIESVCNADVEHKKQNLSSKNRVLYAGTLNKEFGVLDLANAFKELPNAELWLCGAGDAVQELKVLSEKYKNIKYYGFVKHEKVEELQNECDFLINPRRPSGTYTKYSFPSKTVEYMLTAKPVIMYKLEAIPDEYDEYLNYLTADTPEKIAEELKYIFESDYEELKAKGERARKFVLENKNAKVQAQRIIDFTKQVRE